MAIPVIEIGDKVHVIARRLFEGDLRRHFAGEVTALSGDMIRLEGYTFVYNPWKNAYEKHTGKRTRIISVADSGNIINVIPKEVSLDLLHYEFTNDILVITDDAGFLLNVNEFSWNS